MELKVKVVPNSKESSIAVPNGVWRIHLKAPATGGKANKELIEVLAKHFKVKKSQMEILRGATTKNAMRFLCVKELRSFTKAGKKRF